MLVAFIKHIPVCTAGFTQISIPLLEIGKGKPIVSIICGIHGNETASHLVIDELLQKLPKIINGTVRIILAANPPAIAEHRRTNSIDNTDLNRIFPGNPAKTITERLANKLIDTIKDSDAVIDLHSFEMQTPLMGILCKTEANKELMHAFCPKQAWVLNTQSQKEQQFGKSLSPLLTELNTPNIAIEMNSAETINAAQIKDCTEGLMRILAKQKIIPQQPEPSAKFEFFNRTAIHSPEEGIFIPMQKTSATVKRGETIGLLRKLAEQTEINITAPSDGQIMQISTRKFVTPGQEIIAIGEKTETQQ